MCVLPVPLGPNAMANCVLRHSALLSANFNVHSVRKVWRQVRREGLDVARCTVERLMKDMGLEGVLRSKKIKTKLPTRPSNARGTR